MGMAPVQGASVPPAKTVQPKLLELQRTGRAVWPDWRTVGDQLAAQAPSGATAAVSRDASAVPRVHSAATARVISEWDGIEAKSAAFRNGPATARNVESLERLQGEVGWVEVVIISVYVVQLAQIIGQGFGFGGSWWHGPELVGNEYPCIALARLCGFYPGKHKRESRWQKLVFVGVFVLMGVYVVLNCFVFLRQDAQPPSPSHRNSGKNRWSCFRLPRALE